VVAYGRRPKRNQRESAYVSRQRTWRTLPEPSSEIYVEQPVGLEDGTKRVCRLNKALYGLKQSPRIWYRTLALFLKGLGFLPLLSDLGVFAKGYIYLAVYVDDLLIVGPDKSEIQKIKDALSERFQMTDLGPCTYYLGMSVRRDRPTRSLWLHQKGYIEKVLREFNMWECKPVVTPIDTNKLEPSEEGFIATETDRNWYARAIGSLMYAMLGTRPDIVYAVLACSRYMANPGEPYIKAVKRLFRYLRGTINLELTYSSSLEELVGYTDLD